MTKTISILVRAVVPAVSVALATVAVGYAQPSAGSSAMRLHDQSAIAFDQIDRVLLHGEAPPAVDSFSADAATIASLPPLKVETQGVGRAVAGGIGNMLVSTALASIPFAGPFIAGAASHGINAAEQAAQQHEIEKTDAAVARMISAGALSRFAFYHGWLRSEQRNEITIVKPDEGFTFTLNPAKKTVQVIDAHHGPEVIEVDTTGALPPALVGEPITERLPDTTIAGVQARGYRTRATLELKSAVGWCAPGRHAVTQVEYVNRHFRSAATCDRRSGPVLSRWMRAREHVFVSGAGPSCSVSRHQH